MVYRILKKHTKFANADGSIVLEAAVAVPFFLTFALALITLVQLAATEIAVQTAVSETVKQVAHHYQPVYRLQQKAKDAYSQKVNLDVIPSPVRDWIENLINAGWTKAGNAAGDHLLPPLFDPILRSMADDRLLDPAGLKVVRVRLPRSDAPDKAYVEIVAEYRMKLMLPFYEKEWTITKKARERAWLGGPL